MPCLQLDTAYERQRFLQIKAFPWPGRHVELGGIIAGILFNFLLVFAFQQPTRAMVAVIVREKELRLREYMRALGLADGAYWAAWAATHLSVLFVTGLLCAIVGTCASCSTCVWALYACLARWATLSFSQLKVLALLPRAYRARTRVSGRALSQ